MRILMAGGGTGGHLYPAIAVAQELRRRRKNTEIRFVGSRKKLEREIVERYGFKLEAISAKGMPRRPGLGYLSFLVCTAVSFFETLVVLLRWRPDVILGTGGYVSGPVILVASLLKVPSVIHEQNSIPGLTNRVLSTFAEEVHLTFAESRKYFKRKDHLRLTGNPVRKEIARGDAEVALRKFGLSLDRKTVLILGGTRGAHSLNLAVIGTLNRLSQRKDLQFIIQTGEQDYEWVRHSLAFYGARVHVLPYFTAIGDAYSCSDLVVCRAGAMTVSEIATCGIPAVFVPYPHAVYGHQVQNARNLVDRGAAEMILDSELNADILATTIERLVDDPARLKRMSMSARSFARHDTAERIAKSLLEFGSEARRSKRNVHDD
ncbi:MAG: undecaprenyldiphospho-muramoylpentapeptide beta-N-acetylglucosaminyltransferase [Candidatus Eiseniibacteriota bacterium]|nr:MAG: undecaprenyldiphospho-muramoylpentapeptide beta-N-acetylglucosaminyltransferase [Candidatus Eisenbacteria bacterium]